MKKVLMFMLKLIATPFVLALLYLPYLALLFLVTMIGAAIVWWGFSLPLAHTYFSITWKIYAGLGVFSLWFLTMFRFQNCCIGMDRFWNHVKHQGFMAFLEDFVGAIIWPLAWLNIELLGRDFMVNSFFLTSLLAAFEHIFVSSWRGMKITSIDFQSGETRTSYAKSPKDTQNEILRTLTEIQPSSKG